jgi:hypothetical protein
VRIILDPTTGVNLRATGVEPDPNPVGWVKTQLTSANDLRRPVWARSASARSRKLGLDPAYTNAISLMSRPMVE